MGGPGNDGVVGGIGSDTVLGGSGDDFVNGDYGSDRAVVGGEGRDFLHGSRGADRIVGEESGDFLIDGDVDDSWKDVLSGGDGDDEDVVANVPAVRDIASCGGGFDRVVADRKDAVADDCERVRVVHGSEEEVMKQVDAFFESEFWGTFFERLAPDPTAGASLPLAKGSRVRRVESYKTLALLSCPYSPECVEGEFCEVALLIS